MYDVRAVYFLMLIKLDRIAIDHHLPRFFVCASPPERQRARFCVPSVTTSRQRLRTHFVSPFNDDVVIYRARCECNLSFIASSQVPTKATRHVAVTSFFACFFYIVRRPFANCQWHSYTKKNGMQKARRRKRRRESKSCRAQMTEKENYW